MDAYKVEGPGFINVSSGRTSGFMLWHILQAWGGKLPDDLFPIFQNTGLEHEATLVFLKQISERWNVPITWLEYRYDGGSVGFEVVDYCRASRNGEPFTQLITYKKMLPNPVTRFCTSELKIRTANRYAKSLGMDEWVRYVGLRADEPRRVHKIKGDIKAEEIECPMYHAGHTEQDVLEFWKQQDFDLELPGGDNAFGNCQLCFLKGRAKIEKILTTSPQYAKWWIEQEERADFNAGNGGTFRSDRPTYRQMLSQITVQGRLLDDVLDDNTIPCNCTD